eukprot:XP_016658399.1 PREDICTED: DNA replication complex GINS protein PSF1 [Acyrthosiphon pisum]
MYCDKVIELLKELERSREDTIPPYNNDGINHVLSEMKTLDAENYRFILTIIVNFTLLYRLSICMNKKLYSRRSVNRVICIVTSIILKKKMYCDKVIELLKELERSREDTIPPYNNDGINHVLSEMKTLDAEIIDLLRTQKDNLPLDAIRLRRAAIERNKRCLLTYIWTRIQRLKEMRWEIGAILPSDVRQNLSQSEIEWFNNYCKTLVSYMKTIGPDTGLNLTQDTKPPKSLYTEVRSLVDAGKLELESGEVLILRKNSQYMLSRSQAEPLIRQGVLEQVRQ